MNANVLATGFAAAVGIGGILLAARARRGLAQARLEGAGLRRRVAEQDAAARGHETMLASIVESTPTSVVLFTDLGRIVFANAAARDLLFESKPVEGQNFLAMLERASEPLRRGLLADGEELFSVDKDGQRETFHLTKQPLFWQGESHTLMSIKPVGAAIAREENAALKKVIRIIGHEIGNSLGPISSLIGSARRLMERPDGVARLPAIFDTIEERTRHLQSFLEGYARLARLPAPHLAPVPWGPVLDAVRTMWPAVQIGAAPAGPGYFDSAQVQQALINLVKNACEAGGQPGDVQVLVEHPPEGGSRLSVLDRGAGMTDEVLQSALLPFFTTKRTGGGLGLALCREIVELHRGRIRLARRDGGGMSVSMWLPDGEGRPGASLAGSRVRLDLTRS